MHSVADTKTAFNAYIKIPNNLANKSDIAIKLM